jgi:hypothetical protein
VQRAIRKAIADTAGNTGMVLTIAFDYGSRAELVHAAEAARAAGETISEATVARNLYLPHLPSVDVLVRTSGELRISNFMLWQIAGAQVYFTERTWPEFDGAELDAALALAGEGAELVALVKPQFEVGRERIGKGGLVKDEAARAGALADVVAWLESIDWRVLATADSPVTGGDGNREFLLRAVRSGRP